MDDVGIVAAGRPVPGAVDRIRRYCGLGWSGGPPETWAWHYFDAIETRHDDVVTPIDVLTAASLHPALSRTEMAFFREESPALRAFLADLPSDSRLAKVTDDILALLCSLPERFPTTSISLLSKVFHRKRPHLVPMLDRHIVDWYRPMTGERAMAQAWAPIVCALHAEHRDDQIAMALSSAGEDIEAELSASFGGRWRLSWLRAVDIAIWMEAR